MKKILLCLCLLFAYSVADEANKSYRLRSDRVINNNTKNDNVKNDIVTNKKNTTNKNTINKNVKSNTTKNITISDKNGFFIGIEHGISEIGKKRNNIETDKLTTLVQGIRIGYRYFFTDLIGLQAYYNSRVSLGFTGASSSQGEVSGYTADITIFNANMANVDIMFDFYKMNKLSFDAFIGLGLGLGTHSNIFIDTTSHYNTASATTTTYSGFYSDIKVGLGIKYVNNRFGLIIYFPTYPATKITNSIKHKTQLNYAISLSYDYKF